MKPYDIEVQRLKSLRHDKGLFEIDIDALVSPRPARDDPAAPSSLRLPVDQARSTRDGTSGGSCLRLSVEHARTLQLLLKQQFAELDKLQPRSRRSGRC